MAPWPMDSWTAYGPNLVPGAIGTAPDYRVRVRDFSPDCTSLMGRLSAPLQEASGAPPAPRNDTREYRQRYLGRGDAAEVQADRGLDLGEHSLVDAFRP